MLKQEEKKEFTQEELGKHREDAVKYYTAQNKVLKVQTEHEEMKARIAKARAERFMYELKLMEMSNPEPEYEETEGSEKVNNIEKPQQTEVLTQVSEKKERKLKQ